MELQLHPSPLHHEADPKPPTYSIKCPKETSYNKQASRPSQMETAAAAYYRSLVAFYCRQHCHTEASQDPLSM